MNYTDEEYQEMGIVVLQNYFLTKLSIQVTKEDIQEKYSLALKRLVNNAIEIDKKKVIPGVTQVTLGDRSMMFSTNVEAWIITDDVKALLPQLKNYYAW